MILANIIKSLTFLINVVKSINVLHSIMLSFSIHNLMKFSRDVSEYSTYRYDYYVNDSRFYLSQNIWQLYYLLKSRVDYIAVGKIKSIFNDPDISKQWYYVQNEKSSKNLSHELDRLWVRNITGKDVTIGIISHGFRADHRDIHDNYNPQLSFNFIHNLRYVYSSDDGMMIVCAGLISAVADNYKCGVGAAPLSKISILQIYDDEFPNPDKIRTAKAMSYKNNLLNIYVIPWVSQTYPNLIMTIGKEEILALEKGHRFGRNKLGCVYMSASGVTRLKGNNCAFNGYSQRPEINVIGSLTELSSASSPYEACTAVVASVLNTVAKKKEDYLYSTSINNKCENSVGGSWAASSISAGIVALILSFNPRLTARQIMILMIEASTQYDTYSVINSAGFSYSTTLGFGMLNATKMIEISTLDRIKYIPEHHICLTYLFKMNLNITHDSHRTIYIYTTGCVDPQYCVTHLEQVYLVFTLATPVRRSVSMYLISPSGTRLNIIEPRKFDTSSFGFNNWSLKILGFYGEKPNGIWRLQIMSTNFSSLLQSVQLKLYGSCIGKKYNKIFHRQRSSMIWLSGQNNRIDSVLEVADPYISIKTSHIGYDFHSCLRFRHVKD